MEQSEKPSIWYKIVCQHCDDEGYVSYCCKLPIDSANIHPPDGETFEIISYEKDRVRIKHKCNQCSGLKYHLFCSDAWKLEIVEPKQQNG